MRHFLTGLFLLTCLGAFTHAFAGNPIIPNKGVNDPHIRVFDGKAYLYATHDKSADNTTFVMEDWWVWSSYDLVNWKHESTLKPADTYIGKGFTSAWATDAAENNGKYYWYFSEANEQTGVVMGNSPTGPWVDTLGKPMLKSEMTPTHEYDPGILKDGEDYFIIFGAFNYHIARLADDMLSLAEDPQPVEVINARGPYTDDRDGPFAGKGTDDKPFLHKRAGIYYLSWGAFYATADNPYGPYIYRGEILNDTSFKDGTESPTWPQGYLQGRHGSFFDMNGQSYFAYCDISQTGNRYFRDTFISYVHYREDGTISPIRVDLTGTGEYNANNGKIEAEDFFKSQGFGKIHLGNNAFGVTAKGESSTLTFPNIHGLKGKKSMTVSFSARIPASTKIEVLKQSLDGELLSLGFLQTERVGWLKRVLGQTSDRATLRFSNLADTETLLIRDVSEYTSRPAILDNFVFE
ncbi:family 43 glycosylhydrolase [Fretibacter rubidus]|uniref:family 43 glycosylhydrolase n=1 Tax=Fretibacter rubidus TaxID=570162 RepID=UPI00352A870F